MDIRKLLLTDIMIMDLQAKTKEQAIDEMVHQYFVKGIIDDEELYKKDILAREAQSSTGMGDGIAIPHAHDKAVKKPAVLFVVSPESIMMQWMDNHHTCFS